MYSLIDQPWVLGENSSGQTISVSLRDIFDGSADIVRIRGESPAQDYAVLRVLLVIFWRAHNGEVKKGNFSAWFDSTWRELGAQKADTAALEYLEKYADRFDLLSEDKPFMQVADLHLKDGSTREVMSLVPEAQSSYFTMRAGKALKSLSLAEAARWVIYIQAFDYSGIKSGAVGDDRVKGGKGYPIGQGWSGLTGGTVVHGENLFETLLLNTVPEALNNEQDLPVWERSPDGPEQRFLQQPQGPADLATWQSRRIRLFVEEDRVTAVLITNGDRIPEAGANVFGDPMTPYRFSKNKSKRGLDVYFPRPYDVDRTMWRSLDALVVAETDAGFNAKEKAPKRPTTLAVLAALSEEIDVVPERLNLELVSLAYGPQASSVSTTVNASVSMPTDVLVTGNEKLREAVRRSAQVTNDAAMALGSFGGNLLLAAGGEYEFQADLTDRALSVLEEEFTVWLGLLADKDLRSRRQVSKALGDWQEIVRKEIIELAKVSLRGAGPRALVGRIIPGRNEGDNKKPMSAGIAYARLHRKLDDVLPATVKEKSASETPKEG